MKNLKHIKLFKFDYAQYLVSDEANISGLLKVDYKNNKYEFENIQSNTPFAQELAEIAEKLLQRKHNVNMVEPNDVEPTELKI